MTDNTFQVFEAIDIPPARVGAGFGPRESKYPFAQMNVKDMLVIPNKSSKAFGGTVRAAEKSTGFFFVIRSGPIYSKPDENGNKTEVVSKGSLGVWRVAEKAERKPTKERTPEEKAASAAKALATREANKAAKAA